MRQRLIAAAVVAAVTFVNSIGGYSARPASAAEIAATDSPIKKEIERGYRLKDQQRYDEALAAFQGVLKTDPNNHAVLTELGYIHANLKQYSSALKHLGAASEQDPGNMRLHMDLGYVNQALKQRLQAEKQFRIVSAETGEYQAQAQEALKMLALPTVSVKRPDLKQQRLREKGYAALNRKDRKAARKAFEAAVVGNPQDEAALKQLGFINLEDGDLASAATNFEAARAIEPGDHFVALQLGYTYDRLNKKEQARAAYSAALASTDPKIRDAAQAALELSGASVAPALGSSL